MGSENARPGSLQTRLTNTVELRAVNYKSCAFAFGWVGRYHGLQTRCPREYVEGEARRIPRRRR
jgi:hypothetical protein